MTYPFGFEAHMAMRHDMDTATQQLWDDARRMETEALESENAEDWREIEADAYEWDYRLSQGMTQQEIQDELDEAERWYEDYQTYRGVVGL